MALSKTKAVLRAIKLDLKARAFALPALRPYAVSVEAPGMLDLVKYFRTAFGLRNFLNGVQCKDSQRANIYVADYPIGRATRTPLARRWNLPAEFRRYLGHANVK